MFNNPALDVAIGLFFIYALYSLLTTTLTELISSYLNVRGANLKKGLERMLDDDSGIIIKREGKSSVKLSQLFFDRPEIKYLGRKGRRKEGHFPSYIKPETFAKGLLNALSVGEKIDQSLDEIQSTLDREVPTQDFLYNLIAAADSNVERFHQLAEDWFNETMDRVSGWFKKRIQLITFLAGFFIALSMNIDTIAIGQKLSTDPKSRIAMVEAASVYVQGLQEGVQVESRYTDSIDSLTAQITILVQEMKTSYNIMSNNYPKWEGKQSIRDFLMYLLGCFFTAIALSLGSPFWFDLLNKLVQLRGTGVQITTQNKPTNNEPIG